MSVFENHPKKTIACVLLVSLLVADLLSAYVYKRVQGYPLSFELTGHELIEKAYRIPSEFYHHGLAPQKSVSAFWGPCSFTIHTNSLGFKDRSMREVPLVSHGPRVVFIGDSGTEGMGLDYEDTFVGIIDEALLKKGIEVLNAGVASYSPIIYWRKIKYLIENVGLKFDRLVVFIDISDADDEAEYYFLNKQGNVKNKRWTLPGGIDTRETTSKGFWGVLCERLDLFLGDNSILMYTVFHRLVSIFWPDFNRLYESQRINFSRSCWTFDAGCYQEYGKEGLDKMRFYMEKLYDLLKKNNIGLTVAVYPWPAQIAHHDLNSIQATFWEDWCRKHGVRFINYFPYFLRGTAGTDDMRTIDEYFLKDDIHHNKKGHRLIADIFLTDYEQAGLESGGESRRA